MLTLLRTQLGKQPETRKAVSQSYELPPSISEKLPWMDYDAKSQCFALEDGRSVAALFELDDVACESRSEAMLSQFQRGLQGIFQDVFPLYFDDEGPWIVQFYLQDELSLANIYQTCVDYVKPTAKTPYREHYLQLLKAHWDLLTEPQGLFTDTKVSGLPFRGKLRKIRAVLYRRLTGFSKLRRGRNAIHDLNTVAHAFAAKLQAGGMGVRRCDAKDFYEWLLPWFNPAPSQGDGDPQILLKRCPYPGNDHLPFGYDFSEQLFYSVPRSSQEEGVWYFDQKPHKYVPILGLNQLPMVGHLSLERKLGNSWYALFDKFPVGSIFQITVVLQSQEAVKKHLARIENSARRSTSTEAEMAREDCAIAKRAIESGNYFFPTVMGVYLQGDSLEELSDKESLVETLCSSHGFHFLSQDNELTPIDSYLRYLPMAYSYEFDKRRLRRSRYLSVNQLANMLPLYGRERGTSHPLLIFYNRLGEPILLDIFNPKDKDFNSHFAFFGSTGSGKSASCVAFLMALMAIYKPRLVINDVGNSFRLLGEFFKRFGFTVNRVEISYHSPTSLNPFADSQKMLEQLAAKERRESGELLTETLDTLENEFATREQIRQVEEFKNSEEDRDYMGEMALAAQLMITGGEKKEEETITREDRYWILKAVILGAKRAQNEGRDQMIASDLIRAFHSEAEELENQGKTTNEDRIKRLNTMAANISLFCQDNLSSQYFNVPGHPWPDADVTILEHGIFKDEGYEAQRALAFMGIMNKTVSLAEQHQCEERFTVFFADEMHTQINNPLTAIAVTKHSKMSRKYGLWMGFATPNVRDFANDARKMLSMFEFWFCLGMSEAEMKDVESFRVLTEEERNLFRSVRKEAKKFVEGVLLSNRLKCLFRNVPPRQCLALAMTEKHEKAERRKIMEEKNCSELEAAMMIAEKMIADSQQHPEKTGTLV